MTPKSLIPAVAVAAMIVLLLKGCQQGGIKLYCSSGEKNIDNPIDNGECWNFLIAEIQFLMKFFHCYLIDKQVEGLDMIVFALENGISLRQINV